MVKLAAGGMFWPCYLQLLKKLSHSGAAEKSARSINFLAEMRETSPLFIGQQQTVSLQKVPLPRVCSFTLASRVRVNRTVGNRFGLTGYRSNRSGPVPVRTGMKPVQIQNLNLIQKNKKFLKIFQGAMNLMVLNFLKNPFIQYSLRGFEVKQKKSCIQKYTNTM